MKKLFIIAFTLMLAMGATEVSAQSILKKFGDTVKKEIQKEIKNEVNKAAENAAAKVVNGIKNTGTGSQ